MKILIAIYLATIIASLASCSTQQQAQISAFEASPAGKLVVAVGAAAAVNAVKQYDATGKVNPSKVEAAAVTAGIEAAAGS